MRMYHCCFFFAVSFVVSVNCNANASLISKDWQNNGDQLITYDSRTGLSWLDVNVGFPLMSNTSPAYLSTLFAEGELLSGWRFAYVEEVFDLLASAGLPNGPFVEKDITYSNASLNYTLGVENLVELLGGFTWNSNLGYYAIDGMVKSSSTSDNDFKMFDIGQEFGSVYPDDSIYDPSAGEYQVITNEAHLSSTLEFQYGSAVYWPDTTYGSFLVQKAPFKEVPEPATMLLFSIGLIGIAGPKLRKEKE